MRDLIVRFGPYIPLGVVGVLRWSSWVLRRIPSLFYRPVRTPHRAEVTIVSPVYDEDPEVFRRALESWLENDVAEIICVIDVTDQKCHQVAAEHPVTVITTSVPGKRDALRRGWEQATTELVALVDSDTVWARDTADRVMEPFADPGVGGVVTRQNVDHPVGMWQRVADFHLDLRYFDELAGQTALGEAVSCLSGRTAVYRRGILSDVADEFVSETFLGKRCNSGEDKRLTSLLLERGWRTRLQRSARVWSQFPADGATFFRQRLRWARNTWRSDLTALRTGRAFRHPFLAWWMIDKAISPFTLLLGPGFLVYALVRGDWLIAGLLLAWWHLSRAVKMFPHLRQVPSDIRYLPAVVATAYPLAALRIYALATIRTQKWLTRDVEVDDQDRIVRTGDKVVPETTEPGAVLVGDPILLRVLRAAGAGWAEPPVQRFAARLVEADVQRWAEEAVRSQPRRRGRHESGPVELVNLSSSWHRLLDLSVSEGIKSPGVHDAAARDAKLFLMAQVEPCHLTPVSMTLAVAPTLAVDAELAGWSGLAAGRSYDPRPVAPTEKTGVLVGLALARSGSLMVSGRTISGSGVITSAHSHDALLVPVDGWLYLVPWLRQGGSPNGLRTQRLYGRRSTSPHAFAEISLDRAQAVPIGAPGQAGELLRPVLERLRLDGLWVGAGRLRRLVADVAWQSEQAGIVGDPAVAEGLAAAETAAEAAVAMAMAISASHDRGPHLTLAWHWLTTRGSAALELLGTLVAEPIPPALAWQSTLETIAWELVVHRPEWDESHLDPLVAGAVELGGISARAAIAVDRLTDAVRTLRNGRVIEPASVLWAAQLLRSHGRLEAVEHLLTANDGVSDAYSVGVLTVLRAHRRMAAVAVPRRQGVDLPNIEIVVDLRTPSDQPAVSEETTTGMR